MTKKEMLIKINNYWLEEFYFLEKDEPACFICGKEERLEMCHLSPKTLGGSNDFDNLVLLCKRCHSKAPNIKIKEIMLEYIHKESENYIGLLHIHKEHFKNIYESFVVLWKRLENVSLKNNLTLQPDDVVMFIEDKFNENTTYVQSHFDANDQTKVSYMHYLSTYKDLEVDFLAFKLRLLIK